MRQEGNGVLVREEPQESQPGDVLSGVAVVGGLHWVPEGHTAEGDAGSGQQQATGWEGAAAGDVRERVDYWKVSESVWKFVQQMYGGGP